MITDKKKEAVDLLDEKFAAIGQNTQTHLEGLLYSKPITYWDYIQTDILLNLQVQRTLFADEMVFITYHQTSELYFKMILWEINQICNREKLDAVFFCERLGRINRYFDVLTSSFEIMRSGMELEQFRKFRKTLTPASGFQSAQYRIIEFASTDYENLIDQRMRSKVSAETPHEEALEFMYWQAAGKDYQTGQRSYLLSAFMYRYKLEFVQAMENYKATNLWQKFKSLPYESQNDPVLKETMRHYDYTVNVSWVMVHLSTAHHYIGDGAGLADATGGSDWQKYMHPKYQKRVFFPALWSDEELKNWGQNL